MTKEQALFFALKDPHDNTVEVADLPMSQALERICDFIRNMQSDSLAGSVLFMRGKDRADA